MGEYHGDQYIAQGMQQFSEGILKGLEERKNRSSLATSLRKSLSIVDPNNKDDFGAMSLEELQGHHEGITLKSALAKANQGSVGQAAFQQGLRTLTQGLQDQPLHNPEGWHGPNVQQTQPPNPGQTLRQAMNTPGLDAPGAKALSGIFEDMQNQGGPQAGDVVPMEGHPNKELLYQSDNSVQMVPKAGVGPAPEFHQVEGMPGVSWYRDREGNVKTIKTSLADNGLDDMQKRAMASSFSLLKRTIKDLELTKRNVKKYGSDEVPFRPNWLTLGKESFGEVYVRQMEEYNRLRQQLIDGGMTAPPSISELEEEKAPAPAKQTPASPPSDLWERFRNQ